jgi:hypothetical protein
MCTSNLAVQWLTLLLRILEAPGSILSTEASYPKRYLRLSSVSPGKCWDSTLK